MNGIDLKNILSEWSNTHLTNEEYFTFGAVNKEIKGIVVSWCVDDEAIDFAVENNCNFILHHESLLHPYPLFAAVERQPLGWEVNSRKLARLAENDINTFRLHSTMDKLTIFDTLAEKLALQEISAGNEYYSKVFSSPCGTAEALAGYVKNITGMKNIRFAGDKNKKVSRIGLAFGGLGLFVNVGVMEKMIELGADVIIAGESDNMGFRFCTEQNIPVIELSHEVSENYGIEIFAAELQKKTNEVPVLFFENKQIWEIL